MNSTVESYLLLSAEANSNGDTVFTLKQLPPRTVDITYYDLDGENVIDNPSIPTDYYVVAKYNHNYAYYAPIYSDGSVGIFKDNSSTQS